MLFAVLAVLQWLDDDDLWIAVLHTAMALASAGHAWHSRRQAREAARRTEAGEAAVAP